MTTCAVSRPKAAAWCGAQLLFAAFATPAAAQQPTTAQISAIRSSCRTDYQAHCGEVIR